MKAIEKLNLKQGDKVVAVVTTNDLAIKRNYVYTFSHWYTSELAKVANPYYLNHPQLVEFLDAGVYFQVKELINIGNNVHNFDCAYFELYNSSKHPNAIFMTSEKYLAIEHDFITKHTDYLTKHKYERRTSLPRHN